jgi:hypothetical protein
MKIRAIENLTLGHLDASKIISRKVSPTTPIVGEILGVLAVLLKLL